jgi:hypothetical protein
MTEDFMLRQVSPDDWMIIDTRFAAEDPHHLVACLTEEDGLAAVRWFRHVTLPTRFRSRIDALQTLVEAETPAQALTAPTLAQPAPVLAQR